MSWHEFFYFTTGYLMTSIAIIAFKKYESWCNFFWGVIDKKNRFSLVAKILVWFLVVIVFQLVFQLVLESLSVNLFLMRLLLGASMGVLMLVSRNLIIERK